MAYATVLQVGNWPHRGEGLKMALLGSRSNVGSGREHWMFLTGSRFPELTHNGLCIADSTLDDEFKCLHEVGQSGQHEMGITD
jgi:hypothetical protein